MRITFAFFSGVAMQAEYPLLGLLLLFATLNLPVGGYVYVFRSGDEYEIWRGRGDWLGLSALTAQAVIYHLLAHSRDEG